MKYIVTGGAGFIGSHIVDRLVSEGNEVVVIDDESSESHDQFYRNDSAKYYQYDIANHKPWLTTLFEGVDTVFHLAAESRIQPAILNPLKAVETNVMGTCSVLQAARENNVRRVVYSSTSSAYGFNSIPNEETQNDDCLNPYSVSKVSGEKLCKMYYDLFGVETVTFRYFNVYGERQPLRGQYAPVIGKFLRQRKNNEPLTIVPDGEQRRDFTHVSDVVEANILASKVELNKLFDNGDGDLRNIGYGEVFNVGTGRNYSINEVADMISDKKVFIEKRPGEIRASLSNINKAKSVLNWQPKVKLTEWIESQIENGATV